MPDSPRVDPTWAPTSAFAPRLWDSSRAEIRITATLLGQARVPCFRHTGQGTIMHTWCNNKSEKELSDRSRHAWPAARRRETHEARAQGIFRDATCNAWTFR